MYYATLAFQCFTPTDQRVYGSNIAVAELARYLGIPFFCTFSTNQQYLAPR